MNNRSVGVRCCCLFALLLVMVGRLVSPAAAAPEHRRFGVGVPTQNMVDGTTTTNLNLFEGYRPGDVPFNPLGIGWYFNWNWQQRYGPICDPSTGTCLQYMPLVGGWGPGVHPSIDAITTRVQSYPAEYPDGTVWLIGNEIIFDDRRTPLQYAQDYHEFYYGLKSINPTFQVAIGSVITSIGYNVTGFSGTPLQLLDAIRAAYASEYSETMPVDVWNIHPYVWTLPTVQEELNNFEAQLVQFRQWMASVGEQGKPLIITEYGLLNYHEEQRMIDFMIGSFDILMRRNQPNGMPSDEGRLVQQWAWFANNNHVWTAGGAVQWTHCALYNGDTFDMRPLGAAFAGYLKESNYRSVVQSVSLDASVMLADDTTRHTATASASDEDGIDTLRSIRVLLHGADPASIRGYLGWGQSAEDLTADGEPWSIIGDAEGGGVWGCCGGAWEGTTFIAPSSARTDVEAGVRTVEFTFAVRGGWLPGAGQGIRASARDHLGVQSFETTGPAYSVASPDWGDVHTVIDYLSVSGICGVVTADRTQLSNISYIRSLDGGSAIRVSSPPEVRVGDLVVVSGVMRTVSGERYISVPQVAVLAADYTDVGPLYLPGRAVGGVHPDASVRSIYGAQGAYNVGQLIKLCGRVRVPTGATNYFYIEDGSLRDDGAGNTGLRATTAGLAVGNSIPLPADGSYISLVCIASCQSMGSRVVPLLRPRTADDIRVLVPAPD